MLSGLALLGAVYCAWSFVRIKSGLAQFEDREVFTTESEKAEALNRARRAVSTFRLRRPTADIFSLQVRTLRKVNEFLATVERWGDVHTQADLLSLSQWLLAGAVLTFLFPLRWFVLLGGIVLASSADLMIVVVYMFTVQSVYMNFPNIKRRYYWPEMVREYTLKTKQRFRRIWVQTAPAELVGMRARQRPAHPEPLPSAAQVEAEKQIVGDAPVFTVSAAPTAAAAEQPTVRPLPARVVTAAPSVAAAQVVPKQTKVAFAHPLVTEQIVSAAPVLGQPVETMARASVQPAAVVAPAATAEPVASAAPPTVTHHAPKIVPLGPPQVRIAVFAAVFLKVNRL